ncbi:MAG: hypothetical protein J6Q36_03000 [Alistipes sp.]|nr:hypothetical protein [Alistipes sp.]
MKKSLFMLLMLAVAGMAASCEKDVIDPTNENEVNNSTNTVEDADATAMKELLGSWEYISEADENDQFFSHTDYVFYFYENGDGYLTIDAYDKNDLISATTRNSLTYWVKSEKLYVQYGNSSPIEWEYRFKDNTLIMRSDMDEYGNTFVFTKAEDGDMRFIGDWSTTQNGGDKYYGNHIKFVTRKDGFTYYSVYDNPNTAPVEGPSEMVWFKYSTEGNMLIMTNIDSAASTKKYYRFDGGKLYLSNSKDGIETCYSKLKK